MTGGNDSGDFKRQIFAARSAELGAELALDFVEHGLGDGCLAG